jgi:hypothetical protein
MADLEPVGHQLVIVTLVFGSLALATLSLRIAFRIRHRQYDISDTCLMAAMVRSPIAPLFTYPLTNPPSHRSAA